MKRILGTATLMLLCGSILFASKFEGKWEGTIESDMGAMELTVVYKVDGDKLSGTFITDMGMLDFSDGKVSGDTFEMSFEIDWNVIKQTGKLVNDDEILVTSEDGSGVEMEITLKRVKE